MLINMLTGYQPEDLFLPRRATYDANNCIWGQFTLKYYTKSSVYNDQGGEKKKPMHYLPPLCLVFKNKGFWTLILHFSLLREM